MIFLVPDRNGRKKVLKDLNDHLKTFRTLCARICDLSEERSALDKVLADLEAIDKNLSGAQYDNAVLGQAAQVAFLGSHTQRHKGASSGGNYDHILTKRL